MSVVRRSLRQRTLGRTLLVSSSLLAFADGCVKGAPEHAAPQAASAPAVVDVPPADRADAAPAVAKIDLRPLFERYAVTNGAPARGTLYTWTTSEQAAELIRTKVLLSRAESPLHGASYYDQILESRARTKKNKLATLW
jgi:hypothetical protein